MKKHPKGNFRNSHPLLVLGTPNPSFPTVMGWGGGWGETNLPAFVIAKVSFIKPSTLPVNSLHYWLSPWECVPYCTLRMCNSSYVVMTEIPWIHSLPLFLMEKFLLAYVFLLCADFLKVPPLDISRNASFCFAKLKVLACIHTFPRSGAQGFYVEIDEGYI